MHFGNAMLKQYRQILLGLLNNRQIMVMKYMKKVKIYLYYVEYC